MNIATKSLLVAAATAAAMTQAKASSSDMYLTFGTGKGEQLTICSSKSPVPGAGVEFLRESPSRVSDKYPSEVRGASGRGVGKVSMNDFHMVRKAGDAQPIYMKLTCPDGLCAVALQNAASLGKPIESMTVTVVAKDYDKASPKLYTLKNCMITALHVATPPRDLATGQASGRKERKDMLTWMFVIEASSASVDGAPLTLQQDLHIVPVPIRSNSDN